jgi:ribosomal protein L22
VFDQSALRRVTARAPGRARRTKRREFRIRVPLRELRPAPTA